MLRFAKADPSRGFMPDAAAGPQDKDIYDRYAGNLYRQALFTLGDWEMAEQVVSDIIAGECVQAAGAIRGQDPARRLAISAYWRCMELAVSPVRASGVSARRSGDCAGPDGLSFRECGAVGLVVFGGLGYRQVGSHLGISANEAAALLQAALIKAAARRARKAGR